MSSVNSLVNLVSDRNSANPSLLAVIPGLPRTGLNDSPTRMQPWLSSSRFPLWKRMADLPGTLLTSKVGPNLGLFTRLQVYRPGGMQDSPLALSFHGLSIVTAKGIWPCIRTPYTATGFL